MSRLVSFASFVAMTFVATALSAQTPQDPFPVPIPATEGAIRVGFTEFATLPDVAGTAARMMRLVDEPRTRRLFVNDQRGPIYSVSYDGKAVVQYVDVNDAQWNVGVQSQGRERGVQSFAFHPQFGQRGTPGYGKFYTWSDVRDTLPIADFKPLGTGNTHHTVLSEWTARTPTAATYDGAAPRELMRFQQPFSNHNGGMIGFNTLAKAGEPDFALLYVGIGDGGSGGDPQGLSQNLASGFGKLFRIDPKGTNSSNGKYGIPASNPFLSTANALGEIFAYGLRNPQQFAWDPKNGRMFLTDIGQNIVEELDTLSVGANLGWNTYEGSFPFANRSILLENQRADPKLTYPIAEYAQADPLFQSSSASTGLHIVRNSDIPQLANRVLWGDLPSGEVFHLNADDLPRGGQERVRRVLFNDNGTPKTMLELMREKNASQGKTPATRADVRLSSGPNGQIFVLNKADGVIRRLTK